MRNKIFILLLLGLTIGIVLAFSYSLKGKTSPTINVVSEADADLPDFHKLYYSAIGEGKDAYDSFRMLKMFAEQGKIQAQLYLGRMCYNYIDQDYQQSINWYSKAAEQGNADAQYNLGTIYEKLKAPQQAGAWYSQAVENYKKAAESGDIVAQFNLGLAYDSGRGVRQDTQQALMWITKVAEEGYAAAQNILGYWHLVGHKGVKQDIDKGIEWCLKAAKQHYPSAGNNLYHTYKRFGARYDQEKYVYWLRRAAEDGNLDAQWQLGNHYEMGNCEGINKDDKQAVYWYRKGAGQDSDCTFSLARMYRDGKGVEKNSQLADYWYLRANAMFKDQRVARFTLGSMYETGNDIVSKDIYQAQRWYRRAAEVGHNEAQYHLGKIFMDDKDYQQAVFWLKKSAEQDNPLAMQSLGTIYRDGLGVEKNAEYANQWFQEAENATVRSNLKKRLKAFGADAYIVGTNVNVRKFPKTSSQVVAQLNTGHPVKRVVSDSLKSAQGGTVLYESGKWHFIRTEEGIEGWVFNKYLRTLFMETNDPSFKEVLRRELNGIQPTSMLSRKQYNEFVKIFEEGSLDKLKVKMEQENILPNAVYRGEDYENIDDSLLTLAASSTSNAEIIKFLISEGADVNRKTAGFRDLGPELIPVSNMTALTKASVGGRPNVVKALLDAGADINAKDSERMTALLWSLETYTMSGGAYSQSVNSVIKTLLDAGADAKDSLSYAFSDQGVTPEILKLLLDAGADAKSDPDILFMAVVNTEYPEVIELLLDAGANPKAKSTLDWWKDKRAINLAKDNPNLKDTNALKRLSDASYDTPEERIREEAEEKAAQQAAFQKVLSEAESGNVAAQSSIAFMYLLGKDGVEMDGEQAVHWFKKAAAQGDMGSTVQLGVIYRNGSAGIEKNEKEAEVWEQKAKEIIQRTRGFKSNDFQSNASITGDKVNVRTKPNTSSKVIKQLNAGRPVKVSKEVSAKNGKWYFIQTASGTQGWVFGKYVKLK